MCRGGYGGYEKGRGTLTLCWEGHSTSSQSPPVCHVSKKKSRLPCPVSSLSSPREKPYSVTGARNRGSFSPHSPLSSPISHQSCPSFPFLDTSTDRLISPGLGRSLLMVLPVFLPLQPTPHPESWRVVLKSRPDRGTLLLKSCQWRPTPANQGRRLRLTRPPYLRFHVMLRGGGVPQTP